MRLSKDDDGAGESSSITTQRKMLLSYAKDNGFSVGGEYVEACDIIEPTELALHVKVWLCLSSTLHIQ